MTNFLLGAMFGINLVGLYLGRGQTWLHIVAILMAPAVGFALGSDRRARRGVTPVGTPADRRTTTR